MTITVRPPVHYTVSEAVAILGISRTTLNDLRVSGKGPPTYTIGTRRFFPRVKLHQWLDSL